MEWARTTAPGDRETTGRWEGPTTGCGKGEQGMGSETKRTKQQPFRIGKPVAMEWLIMGEPWGAWPREVWIMP